MFDFVLIPIRTLFFRNTNISTAWTGFVWLALLIILSLLLRTYIIPWLLASTSKHIRVRSISPRSIRGLFIRTGVHECRVERITYAWTHVEGERRINIIIEGMSLALSSVRPVKSARNKRTLTLADLSPSPLAGLVWELLGDSHAFLEPYIRPYLRAAVVKCIQFFIRWVPRISRAVTFDLHSATITLPDTQGTEFNTEKMQLHTLLSLSPLESTEENLDNGPADRATPLRPPHGMGAWRKRFREGFARSLDRALGDIRATASVSLQLQGLRVSTGSQTAECNPLVKLPGKLDLEVSVSFNPRTGTMEEQSLGAAMRVGDCVIHADSLLSFLEELKRPGQTMAVHVPLLVSNLVPHLPETPTAPPPTANTLGLSSPLSALDSTFFSPLRSSKVPSISALASPASPFLEVISTSLRSSLRTQRQQFLMPCQKLKGYRCDSSLSFLQRFQIAFSRVNLVYIRSSDSSKHTYQAKLLDIKFDVFRSSPMDNPLHVEVFGRRDTSESFDPEVYGISSSVGSMNIERHTIEDTWHLLTVGRINIQALASQWPFPWLTSSPFLSSDPNAAVLAMRMHVDGAKVTERLEDLDMLLKQFTSSASKAPANPNISAARKPFPRLSLAFSSGPLLGSVICKAADGNKTLVMQLKTAGFSAFSLSRYQDAKRPSSMAGIENEMNMMCEMSLTIEPVFAVVLTDTDSFGIPASNSADMHLIYHPTLLSSGAVVIRCQIGASAIIDDRIGSIACIETATLTADCHVSGDALCIELWHPDVIVAALQILTILPPTEKTASLSSDDQKTSNTALGLSVSVGLGRFVLFATSPDLNPHDDLGLSRGVALRTAVALQFCSLGARHLRFLGDFHERSLKRQKLDLAQELFIDAAASASHHSLAAAPPPQFLTLAFSRFLLRGAVATPFEVDDPLIVEHDGDAFVDRDFFSVAHAELKMSSYSISQRKVSINVPLVTVDFESLHVYEVMLASQTLRSLQQVRSHKTPSSRVLQVEAKVSSLLISWALPKQKLLMGIRDVVAGYSTDKTILLQFDEARLSTSLASKASCDAGDGNDDETWGELANLQKWYLKVPRNPAQLEIIANGENALVRMPSGYIFADLIHDLTVVSKAVRHMMRMVEVGSYHDFPIPEPEPPKLVPRLRIGIGQLVLEAEDDPFESRLGLIWRTGFDAVKTRLEREKAFEAKVATINAAESGAVKGLVPGNEYHFDATHTISVQEARRRLDEVHALDWILRLGQERRKVAQTEQTFLQFLRSTIRSAYGIPPASDPRTTESNSTTLPPLFRSVFFDLDLKLSPPSFQMDHLPTFLFEQGNLPTDTTYSLVVPMHIHFTLSALHASLRDYPLPMISIPASQDKTRISWECDTDLVIAEEMGTEQSVDWVECPVIQRDQGVQGVLPLSIIVAKTIMPVKSYANPLIMVRTDRPTIFTWGVSYGPAIQDLMRIVDTLSSAPRDDSPVIGFWDKMKLILHWTVRMSFENEVLLYLKGSRDPYYVHDAGAGFALCWNGNTKLLINRENDDRELVQVISDSLTLAIPDLDEVTYNQSHYLNPRYKRAIFRKVCAKFQTAVRFGVGVVLERTCSQRCTRCTGSSFIRECRIFDFVPHHKIKLEKKKSPPSINSAEDSFTGFRSDFVHLSVSLTSSPPALSRRPNSFHLSTRLFAHFWSWWTLFDGVLFLPIRQGSHYPRRIITPKLGRHLATIKYRLLVPHLYMMHGYLDDTEETWVDGVTPWVGLKGMIDHFQADFHQRDEEARVVGMGNQAPRSLHRKAFCAAEVVLKGIELRALVATFAEPEKKIIKMMADTQRSNYRERTDLPRSAFDYPWYDPTDFVELDWSPTDLPKLHILPIGTCPYFAYFKRDTAFATGEKRASKFGLENSHTCSLNTEPSIYHVQMSLAEARIMELEQQMHNHELQHSVAEASRLKRMIILLEEYISLIKASYMSPDNDRARNYLIPSETVSPYEWVDFDNVYQVHSPTIYLDAAIRDILMRYYYCSRARRSFEYHLATRAVKFIRDQANAALNTAEPERSLSPTQVAATALRKILKSDNGKPLEEVFSADIPESLDAVNPLDGWSDGVSLQKSHYCLLLKPQVVLRGELDSEPCIVATIQAKLQSFAVMDDMNADDPVSGKVMTRNYAALLGLQAFSPSNASIGPGRVPLEVLVDLKCESNEFDRLVPQTDAMFHYDKFNHLRLRNNVNSAVERGSTRAGLQGTTHLRDQTDLLRIHIPRFAVSATDKHFQCIANIVTELILFSDAAQKTRLGRLENFLIKYDFSDFYSAAGVVENLQYLLRSVLENERQAQLTFRQSGGDIYRTNHLQIRARALTLGEELNLLFDAIRLAQDKSDVTSDQKSALLLQASSSVMSWNMLADGRDLISKLEVQETKFFWLSRQDGSTVNNLRIGNLEAFDGSQHAQWAEILSKHNDPTNHPLLKRGLLLTADWVVLPPVGGITVYETFELSLHPIRLQIDSRVGRRIMEYLWPARKDRYSSNENNEDEITPIEEFGDPAHQMSSTRVSLDSPRALQNLKGQQPESLGPPIRKLVGSSSFTDLRSSNSAQSITILANRSAESLTSAQRNNRGIRPKASDGKIDVAAEMRTRSGQKTFILVRIDSLDLLLSVLKEGSFECHDARIKTRQLEYRNKTWSFEELVDQFIPSNMTWRGWVKMALQQPLLPVFPVARELFMKTKFSRNGSPTITASDNQTNTTKDKNQPIKQQVETQKYSTLQKLRRKQTDTEIVPLPTTVEITGTSSTGSEEKGTTRTRVLSIFGRRKR